MTMRISTETLVVVGIIISVFLLGIICLACSLNPREILDCSFLRCCSRRRRHVDDDEPQTYETLNEYIFESNTTEDSNGEEQESGAVIRSLNNGEDVTTTMSQVFPDILGGETGAPIGRNKSNNNDNDRPDVNQSSNAELSEPLL